MFVLTLTIDITHSHLNTTKINPNETNYDATLKTKPSSQESNYIHIIEGKFMVIFK